MAEAEYALNQAAHLFGPIPKHALLGCRSTSSQPLRDHLRDKDRFDDAQNLSDALR
jgi:hypothetical protein